MYKTITKFKIFELEQSDVFVDYGRIPYKFLSLAQNRTDLSVTSLN